MKKKTLIIGGGGYIGSHLIASLLATGRYVTVMGRSNVPRYPLPENVDYCIGDFAERDLIDSLVDDHQEIIHLAYATVPNTSFDNPLADLLQNLPPTVHLFSKVAQRGGKLILVSSGGTVYGKADSFPIPENHPSQPISPYGVTKLTLEKYAHLYAVTHGLQVICVRPGNAYGVGQRPYIGQGFISTAMASMMNDEPIKIFGERGTIRDYVYVTDLAAGIVSALVSGHLSETYNIGSGVGRSNMDVIEAISPLLSKTGSEMRTEYLPERVFDVHANILDSTKLNLHTGWTPKIEFQEGLLKTRDWLRDYCG